MRTSSFGRFDNRKASSSGLWWVAAGVHVCAGFLLRVPAAAPGRARPAKPRSAGSLPGLLGLQDPPLVASEAEAQVGWHPDRCACIRAMR